LFQDDSRYLISDLYEKNRYKIGKAYCLTSVRLQTMRHRLATHGLGATNFLTQLLINTEGAHNSPTYISGAKSSESNSFWRHSMGMLEQVSCHNLERGVWW